MRPRRDPALAPLPQPDFRPFGLVRILVALPLAVAREVERGALGHRSRLSRLPVDDVVAAGVVGELEVADAGLVEVQLRLADLTEHLDNVELHRLLGPVNPEGVRCPAFELGATAPAVVDVEECYKVL